MQHLTPSSEEEIRLRDEDSELDGHRKLGGIKRIKPKNKIPNVFNEHRKSVERKVPVKTSYNPRENKVI